MPGYFLKILKQVTIFRLLGLYSLLNMLFILWIQYRLVHSLNEMAIFAAIFIAATFFVADALLFHYIRSRKLCHIIETITFTLLALWVICTPSF